MMDERLKKIQENYFGNGEIEVLDFDYIVQQAEKVPGLERDREYWYVTYQEQKKLSRGQIKKLQEENQRYKEALEFYADEKSWERDDAYEPLSCPIMRDSGEKAQQALKGESRG